MDGRIYMLQPSFASGEISPDVASRVDLDKYHNALLQAENVFIRPYGSAYRRPGLEYKGFVGGVLGDDKVRLQEFAVDASRSYLLLFRSTHVDIYKESSGTLSLVTTKTTPFTDDDIPKLRFAQSADVMFIASGTNPVQVLKRTGTDTFSSLSDFVPSPGYFDYTTATSGVTITPSAQSGSGITLTASANVFSQGVEGNCIILKEQMASRTVTQSATGKTNGVLVGGGGWKIITHGTWKGSFKIESCKTNSNNDADWQTIREYSSDNDFNVTESGTVDGFKYLRLNVNLTSGTFTGDLTRLPFTHDGWARIVNYTDAKHVTADVIRNLGSTNATDDWAFGSWDENFGYPSCVTFFQDRLCFAANDRQPYMVWMSRTGDYYNFGTESVEGTLTDDSAVAISFISRKDFRILHLMAEADLLVMTEGNEWVVSGSEVVTPTNVTPKVQTSRGTTDVDPVMIGGQMIYVQRHGRTVRDMQYNFSVDSYDGMDLTILAKHITRDVTIVDATYRQEPDYMMFFVLSDGTMACLTYVNEQKVFAWSRMKTYGKILAVEKVSGNDYDEVYLVVNRLSLGVTLEKLSIYPHTESPDDYVMLDCAYIKTTNTTTTELTASWLAGYTVDVLADGRYIRNLKADNNGKVTLPAACKKAVMGLPYTSTWELPNIEMQLQDGTLQGRRKKVSEVILRLERSLGGRVGINTNKTDVIKYDELMEQIVTLYSGEKIVTVPNVTVGGFNDKGRVVVVSSDPYPLSISSIVRAVVPGG